MKNLNSLERQHESMTGMYSDFMDAMKEYMNVLHASVLSNLSDDGDEEDSPVIKSWKSSKDDSEDSELSLDEEEGMTIQEPFEESNGYEFDELGDPILQSYDEDEIDPEDPSFAYGKHLGIPKTLVLNFNPRGDFDSLIPFNDEEE